jgi:hypothetical protein
MKRLRALPTFAVLLVACATRQHASAPAVPRPPIIPHAQWQAQPPLGYAADATRRNIGAGGTLGFKDFKIDVLSTAVDSTSAQPSDVARVRLSLGTATEERVVREGTAFNWNGYHVAVVAVYGPKELGAGLVALEIATVASLPPQIANATTAGGANMRLRVPHNITHVTLHHTGDARPLSPTEDPVQRLRGLQAWGASDRNWWDVPYHFLMDLKGNIYEGRDYHYIGETNTAYNPGGHFLISIIGNYALQEPTQEQINAIADLMAWAVKEFDVPLDRIGGHYNYATTECPGTHLRKYLEDGTLKRMVAARVSAK